MIAFLRFGSRRNIVRGVSHDDPHRRLHPQDYRSRLGPEQVSKGHDQLAHRGIVLRILSHFCMMRPGFLENFHAEKTGHVFLSRAPLLRD
jgi:hypothetical protein